MAREQKDRPGDGLVPTVQALQEEVDGLRESARLRAVIEQAKGVIVERHGITSQEAFERLRVISQQQNARMVDVAATVIGLASPSDGSDHVPVVDDEDLPRQAQTGSATSAVWRSARDRRVVRASAVGVIVESLAQASEDGDAAIRLLLELASCRPDAGMLFVVRDEMDHLELLGSVGYDTRVTTGWSRVSLSMDVPVSRCARSGRVEFITGPDALLTRYPGLAGPSTYGYQAWAFVPIVEAGRVAGVALFGWSRPEPVPELQRRQLVGLVQRAGSVFLRGLSGRELDPHELADVLRLSADPWLVLAPLPGSKRGVQNLAVESVAPEVEGGEAWVGRRLLVAFPHLATEQSLLNDLMRLLVEDGLLVLDVDAPKDTGAPWDAARGQLRVVRTGRRLVLSWRAA